jgi:hypothetical protein
LGYKLIKHFRLEDFSPIEWLATQAVAKHKEGKLEDAIAPIAQR